MAEDGGDSEPQTAEGEESKEDAGNPANKTIDEQSEPRLAVKVIHPKKKKPRAKREYVAIVRPLSLIAAACGILSLMLPWIKDDGRNEFNTLWSFVGSLPTSYDLVFGVVAGLVLLGSILSVLSSIGVLPTIAGILAFTLHTRAELDQATAGFYVALMAVALGVASLVIKKPARIWDRFLVLSPRGSGRISMDVLALVASSLALIVAFMPWAVFTEDIAGSHIHSSSISLVAFVDANFAFGTLGLAIASALFIFGAVLLVINKLGVFPMLAGTAWTLIELIPMMASYKNSMYSQSLQLGYGIALGIVALGIGVLSIAFPVRFTIANRLAVWRRVEPEEAPAKSGIAVVDSVQHQGGALRRFTSHWKKIAAVAVVLAAVVAFAGLAYGAPFSKIELVVTNETQRGLTAFVIAYIDGEEIRSGYVSPFGSLILEATSTAGVHAITLDYVAVENNQTPLDGIPEWSSDVKASPFQKQVISLGIFYEGWQTPEVQVYNESIPNGQKVTVASVDSWNMGVQVSASILWGDVTIIVWDGSESASWSPWSSDLSTYPAGVVTWSPPAIELGNLSVRCNITDLVGNGNLNPGDYMTITSEGATGFSSESSYKIYIMGDYDSSLLAEVDFRGT